MIFEFGCMAYSSICLFDIWLLVSVLDSFLLFLYWFCYLLALSLSDYIFSTLIFKAFNSAGLPIDLILNLFAGFRFII